ncbi:MAG TPA: alanine racemase [Solibacterales bacterium]|nr:alanine racemase [Bryobacterales bacterium]
MPPVYPFRSWVEVSRSQIASNFRAVRAVVGERVEVMPVVKADAYRHGANEVSRVLTGEGARWLAVSNAEEGVLLRQYGITARILVMADFLPGSRPAMLEYGLTPVIHSLRDLRELNRLAALTRRTLPFHLKIDTGMGRLGTRAPAGEIAKALHRAKRLEFEGLMTHFASSADYANPQTGEQILCFEAALRTLRAAGFNPRYLHLSSTNPVAYNRAECWADGVSTCMVRPGHAIYGYVSPARGGAPKRALDVKPALEWRAAVIAVKNLPAGARVGYGGIHVTAKATRIAVVAAGYADGVPHRLSNKGRVIAGGRFAPVLGAVSMDLTTIDVSDIPELRVGDQVTIIGSEGECSQDAQQLARAAGTISYSVLCGISARVKRVYV